MGKLSAVAERIKDTKVKLEAEADKLAEKLDKIDVDAPAAFAKGHNFLDAQRAEVAEIEATLRQLSNLPLGDSAASPDGLSSFGSDGKPLGSFRDRPIPPATPPPREAADPAPFVMRARNEA